MNALPLELILVDDDNISNFISRTIIRHVFASPEIHSFTCAEAALEHLRGRSQAKPGTEFIIFLDINMPGQSGWDFLEQFGLILPDLPARVVMLTSSADPRDRERAFTYPRVVDYFSKPVQMEALLRLQSDMAWAVDSASLISERSRLRNGTTEDSI